jgi:hypothetical protein
MPTNYTKKYEKMGIPIYTAVVGFENTRGMQYSPIKVKITHRDFIGTVQELRKGDRSKESEYVNKAIGSRKRIAEALYSLNKEAKRYRDIQALAVEAIYGNEPDNRFCDLPRYAKHRKLHEAKKEKEALYRLKDRAMARGVAEWGIKASGYHVMADGKKMGYMEIEGYSFHTTSITSNVNLGNIAEKIAADRRRSMPPKKAKKVIEAFLSQGNSAPAMEEEKSEVALLEAG